MYMKWVEMSEILIQYEDVEMMVKWQIISYNLLLTNGTNQ